MKIPDVVTIDFETKKIMRRPEYPPKPVGVSILYPGEKKARYWAWGHPLRNNCTFSEGKNALSKAWYSGLPLLFQNSIFDVEVGVHHMGMKMPVWDQIHDTLFLIFLDEPQAITYSLKPSAERLLGMPPDEKDAVVDWLQERRPEIRDRDEVTGEFLPWEAYISEAPGDLVGSYANGDVIRTKRIFQKLLSEIIKRDMWDAYQRERQLMPILLETEQGGIRVDLSLMDSDLELYTKAFERVEDWMRKKLKAPSLNFNQKDDFADALEKNRMVDPGAWIYTRPTKAHPGGKRSTSKKNLVPEMIKDRHLALCWMYRNRLATCMRNFMQSWHRTAHKSKGYIYTHFNQVCNSEHGNAGARTGRMQTAPNFQNIPKNFDSRGDGYEHPKFLRDLPPLPLMRKYLLPDSNTQLWGHRDYSQQELRILAHFEDGALLQAYLDDPKLDVHNIVHEGFKAAGFDFDRTIIKNFDFQVIYGGGIPAICGVFHCSPEQAKHFMQILKQQLPGYDELNKAVKHNAKAGFPTVTWGGRQYYCPEPSYSKKHARQMSFEYKMLNYLVQGSAADCTKQAIINYCNHPKRKGRFLIAVHDEINISADRGLMKQELAVLGEAMSDVEFDLPMLSDSKFGPRWSELQKVEAAA